MKKIILGSGSPRRKELLTQLIGDNYEVISSPFEEDNSANLPPEEIAKIHSIGKAKEVAKTLNEGIVIGSDTFIYFNEEVLGKPKTYERAKDMLKSISGKEVEVYSGVALVEAQTMKQEAKVCITKIKIRNLNDKLIEDYLKVQNPMGNAGALVIQDKGAILVEKTNGDYNAVVGMPLYELNLLFEEFGINIFDYHK